MSNFKCPECGLINWAEDQCCKRCKTPLVTSREQPVAKVPVAKLTEPPIIKRAERPFDIPSVYCLNGIGTRLLGWRHHQDGTATASTWFTFFYAPIFPGSRYRLAFPDSVDQEPNISFSQIFQAFLPIKRLYAEYEFIEQLPLSGKEVLRTYLYAYLWLPIILFVPLAVILFLLPKHDPNDGSTMGGVISISLMLVWFGYVLFVLSSLLHRTRGGVR
jgi:hypothetical protein